jgi:phosphatidylserine/phosphatidylglycerophosphate/cardiolipin synthase-like enzyme
MKKQILSIIVSLSFLLFPLYQVSYATDLTLNNTPSQVYFSPKGGCTEAIVRQIANAKSEILVQAYSFTSVPIAKALLNAHKRGIKVEAILDKSQRKEKYTSATFLANSGIPTFIDDRHAIAHSKIMIIDRETVITGSFNFTKAAEEKNAENLLIIRNNDLAKLYRENWEKHKEHSERYDGR